MTGAQRLCVVGALLCAWAGAAAQGVPARGGQAAGASSATITNTLTTQYRQEAPGAPLGSDTYGFFLDRLNLVGASGALSTNLRIDTAYFVDAQGEGLQDDVRIERMQLGYDLGRLKLVVGDYYRQLGRGLLLSLRKVDELGLDVTLRGALLEYHGQTHQGSLFAGRTNPVNLDLISQRWLEDTNDLIVGGHSRHRLHRRAYVGAQAMFLRRDKPILPEFGEDETYAAGLTVELPQVLPWLSVYAESNAQIVRRAGEESHRAQASYATIDLSPEDWSILIEGLYLGGLSGSTSGFEQVGGVNRATQESFRYNQMPTLERIDMEVGNVEDVYGGRLRVERFFLEGDLSVHANGLLKREDAGEPAALQVLHGYGGVEYVYGGGASRISLDGGWRQTNRVETGQVFKVVGHADFDWVQAFGGGLSLHIQSLNQFRRLEQDGDQFDDNWRGSQIIGLDKAGLGSLAFEYGFDTQATSQRTHFYAGSFLYNGLNWLQLRGAVGTERGGIKCIAGVCRNFPEFAGARLDIVLKHALTTL